MPEGVLQSSNQMSDASKQVFMTEQLLKQINTAIPVVVVAVNNPDNEQIDVAPMIHQENASGDIVEHSVIYNVPVMRLQRGNSAVIMRPKVGDKGLVVFASQDISIFKKIKNFCKAGTFRRTDWADAVYVMGMCNDVPTQYIEFNDDNITIVTPKLIINAATEFTGTIKANGKVIDNTHQHTDPQGGTISGVL